MSVSTPLAPAPPATGGASRLRAHRTVTVVTVVVVAAILAAPTAMSPVARLTLAVFTIMLSLTAFTKANEVAVCIGALVALVLVGGSSAGDAVGAVTSHTVVLLVAAFVVAAAARRSGLAERMAFAIGGRCRTVDQLMVRITWVLIATAFLVPSTSGRAALMLPVYLAFAERIGDRRVRRALAVLFPSVILLSAVASLFGAGAHLVMTELLVGFGESRIGYVEWAAYGLPFAIASSFVALYVVRLTFLGRDERSQPVDLRRATAPWSRVERIVSVVLGAVTVLWLTEPLHGVAAWMVAVVGAAAVTVGPFRAITLAGARAALPLDLLFVMAVTAEAGAALARTGAADWIALTLLGPLTERAGSALSIVFVIALVSLLAHLVVTSRTARASVLLPVVILVGGAAGLDVTAIAFLSTAAAGYCLTTTTSAKPIRVFSTVEDGYDERDLRRLSLRLLPVHVLLLLGFSFLVWPMLGLALGPGGSGAGAGAGTRAGDGTGEDRAVTLPWAGTQIDGLGVGPRWAPSPSAAATPDGNSATGDGDVPPAETGTVRGIDAAATTTPSTTSTTSTSTTSSSTTSTTITSNALVAPAPTTPPTAPPPASATVAPVDDDLDDDVDDATAAAPVAAAPPVESQGVGGSSGADDDAELGDDDGDDDDG